LYILNEFSKLKTYPEIIKPKLSYVIKVEDDSNNPRLEQTFKFYNKKSKNTKLQYLNSLNINRPVDASFEAKDQQALVIR
jgi:hypothetical protein